MLAWPELQPRLQALQDADVARLDPLTWHYLNTLSERSSTQTESVQNAMRPKLEQLLSQLEQRITPSAPQPQTPPSKAAPSDTPSALAQLLVEMGMPATFEAKPQTAASGMQASNESPRVQQFRKQLRTLSVQKQVRTALSKAPQNAGPINSHMLVLRALGLMRELSPEYLQRFMSYVDTLIVLESVAPGKKTAPKKSATRTGRKSS